MKNRHLFNRFLMSALLLFSVVLFSGLAKADPNYHSFRKNDEMVNNVKVISVEDRDMGGWRLMDITVEDNQGQRTILHCCDGNGPQIFPNGTYCPFCAAHYDDCKELLTALAGTDQRVSFFAHDNRIQGFYTGDDFHCFLTLG